MREHDHNDGLMLPPWHVREYDLAEYMTASVNEPPHRKNANHDEHETQTGNGYWDDKWRGGTLEEAKTFKTWEKGREYLAAIDLGDVAMPELATTKRVRRWSDDGDEYSRDRFDAGYNECWQTRKRSRVRRGGGTLRITVELGADWTHKAEELIWSGVAALKLADTLEDAGYRVQIDVTVSNCRLNKRRKGTLPYRMVDVIRVKDHSDPVNIDALLLAVACPLFFRFHAFASKLRRPVRVSDRLGLSSVTPTGLQGDIHINRVFNRHDAERVARDDVAKLVN